MLEEDGRDTAGLLVLLAGPVTVLPPAGLLVLEDDGRYAEGLLVLLAGPETVLPPAGLLLLEDDGRYAEGLLAFDEDGLYADCLLPRPPRA